MKAGYLFITCIPTGFAENNAQMHLVSPVVTDMKVMGHVTLSDITQPHA